MSDAYDYRVALRISQIARQVSEQMVKDKTSNVLRALFSAMGGEIEKTKKINDEVRRLYSTYKDLLGDTSEGPDWWRFNYDAFCTMVSYAVEDFISGYSEDSFRATPTAINMVSEDFWRLSLELSPKISR